MLFAGQFETYLFQKGEPVILEAIKKCWASSYSLRVMQHRLDCGLSTNNITMAVVVQVCLLVLIYHDNVKRNVLLVLQLHNRYHIRQNFSGGKYSVVHSAANVFRESMAMSIGNISIQAC